MSIRGIPAQERHRKRLVSLSEWALNFTSIRANLPLGELKKQRNAKVSRWKIPIGVQVLLEWGEAGWITQRSAPFDSSATLWQTLAGRRARITWQHAALQQTSIFVGCSDQKRRAHLWRRKAQVLSSSSVLWKAHLSEVGLPQSVCCPKQNTGRSETGKSTTAAETRDGVPDETAVLPPSFAKMPP